MINIQDVITTGKFISVEFVTKSGSVSVAWGRTGVHKYTKGGRRTVKDSEYINLWCFYRKRYVNVNRATIISVNGEGVTFEDPIRSAKAEGRRSTTASRAYMRHYARTNKTATERR